MTKIRFRFAKKNMKKLIGEHRHNSKAMQKSKQWFVKQGEIHSRDYWELLPELKKVFDGVE